MWMALGWGFKRMLLYPHTPKDWVGLGGDGLNGGGEVADWMLLVADWFCWVLLVAEQC